MLCFHNFILKWYRIPDMKGPCQIPGTTSPGFYMGLLCFVRINFISHFRNTAKMI